MAIGLCRGGGGSGFGEPDQHPPGHIQVAGKEGHIPVPRVQGCGVISVDLGDPGDLIAGDCARPPGYRSGERLPPGWRAVRSDCGSCDRQSPCGCRRSPGRYRQILSREVFLAVICQHREFQSQIGNGQNPINGIASQGIGVEGIITGLGIFPVQTLLGQSQQMGGILFCLTLLPQVAEGKAQGSQQQTASPGSHRSVSRGDYSG